jgi:hypothetical protein
MHNFPDTYKKKRKNDHLVSRELYLLKYNLAAESAFCALLLYAPRAREGTYGCTEY